MNQAVRDRVIAEAARRNGVDPKRLKFLQDNPDQVLVAADRAVDGYRENHSRELDFTRSEPGALRRDPLGKVPRETSSDNGRIERIEYSGGTDGRSLSASRPSMDWLKATTPPPEPLIMVPVLGLGRRSQDRVDPKLIAGIFGKEDGDFVYDYSQRAIVQVAGGETYELIGRDENRRPTAIQKLERDARGEMVPVAVIAVNGAALDKALGVTPRPETFDDCMALLKATDIAIVKSKSVYRLNGKRISKRDIMAMAVNPMAMVVAKETALAKSKFEPYEGYKKLHGHYYNPAEGVLQSPTHELYEDGGFMEEVFGEEGIPAIRARMQERHEQEVADGRAHRYPELVTPSETLGE